MFVASRELPFRLGYLFGVVGALLPNACVSFGDEPVLLADVNVNVHVPVNVLYERGFQVSIHVRPWYAGKLSDFFECRFDRLDYTEDFAAIAAQIDKAARLAGAGAPKRRRDPNPEVTPRDRGFHDCPNERWIYTFPASIPIQKELAC